MEQETLIQLLLTPIIILLILCLTIGPINTYQLKDIEHLNEKEIENLIHQKINQERTSRQKLPLTTHEPLAIHAKSHSEWMQNNTFEHSKQKLYAENIVMVPVASSIEGCDKPTWSNEQMATCMVKLWVNSPGHFTTLIKTKYTQTGIGVKCNIYACFSTQNFK